MAIQPGVRLVDSVGELREFIQPPATLVSRYDPEMQELAKKLRAQYVGVKPETDFFTRQLGELPNPILVTQIPSTPWDGSTYTGEPYYSVYDIARYNLTRLFNTMVYEGVIWPDVQPPYSINEETFSTLQSRLRRFGIRTERFGEGSTHLWVPRRW